MFAYSSDGIEEYFHVLKLIWMNDGTVAADEPSTVPTKNYYIHHKTQIIELLVASRV